MSRDSEIALNINTINHLRVDVKKYREMIQQYEEIIKVSVELINTLKADLYHLDYRNNP